MRPYSRVHLCLITRQSKTAFRSKLSALVTSFFVGLCYNYCVFRCTTAVQCVLPFVRCDPLILPNSLIRWSIYSLPAPTYGFSAASKSLGSYFLVSGPILPNTGPDGLTTRFTTGAASTTRTRQISRKSVNGSIK